MDLWLVVGLGNQGARYEGTRHNIGAHVVEELAARHGASLKAHKARARVAEARLGTLPGGAPGPRVVLAVPTCWMNESGGPTKALAQFYKVPPARVLVLHDDLDLDLGQVKVKAGGGEGGHNGLRSISSAFGTRDYPRLRLGIGRPPGRMQPADFVLKTFGSKEAIDVEFLVGDAEDEVARIVTGGEVA